MCGIAGILGRVSDGNRAALRRMSDAMVHRGPDASGVWESSPDVRGHGAMLAHRRLSILDLSPAGAQPMVDATTGHAFVYNGEVYNYPELRERLGSRGETFRSTGDTEVVLRALGLHGREAVGWLRGMFALAVWDTERRRLLVARDPLGMKPLYFARCEDDERGWSLAFASEVRALLASGLLGKAELHPHAAAKVVWNGFIVGPDTAVRGVRQISPGELKVFDASGREELSEEYWSVPDPALAPPMDEEGLARVLEDCLRTHLVSDVPLGVFLSGGVDSSAVANLAQRAAQGKIHTFTLAFEEDEFNEGPAARKIAEAIGTDHQEVVLTERHFVSGLEGALDSLDQPTFDGINSYYMSHAVRDAGFTVALVGTGGDELFGGYTSFRDLPRLLRSLHRVRGLPREALALAARLVLAALMPSRRDAGAPFPPQTRWAKLPEMVRGADLLALYQLAYALFLPESQRELVGAEAVESLVDGLSSAMHSRLERETRGRSPLSAISVMEQRMFLGERLLRDNDAASMAASIEQRLPLVDQVLFESVDRVPDATRYAPVGKKALLRRIGLRGLDPALFDRPKSGFVLPFDRWIRQGLHKAVDETLRDEAAVTAVGLNPEPIRKLWRAFLAGAPGVPWSRIWAVFVLVRWCHQQGVLR
jgi:asparagine synthase (glutamine-hydrolysing)